MLEFLSQAGTNYMPHGGCFLWQPGVLWTHVASDAVIGLSYFSIPLALAVFVRKREDLAFSWMFIMFASFILFCGATHLAEIWTTWKPFYWTEGFVKAATALVSALTAVSLWPLIPRALRLPSPSQLQEEVQQRKQAQQELRQINRELEQEVQERTKELEQFVYAASHDLREPMRVMQTYSEFLEEDLEEENEDNVQRDVKHIKESARQMQEQIDSLLKLSRIRQRDLERTSIDMDEVLDDTIDSLEQSIQESGARIDRDELPEVEADRPLMMNLFQNLISNAIKYAGDDPPTLRITASREDDRWILGVRDRGLGVPEEKKEEIFEPFVHLHSWDEYEGSGIGLSICRRIVREHGGEIWVESNPAEGSHFKFTIPSAETENQS